MWELMRKSWTFEGMFEKSKKKKRELTDELFSHFKEVICTLYGNKEKVVNKVQWLKFRDKNSKKDKTIDMSVLIPCKVTLNLYSVQTNYFADVWCSFLRSNIDAPNLSGYGWDSGGMLECIIKTMWMIHFLSLYLRNMITNLVASAKRTIMIVRCTHVNI